MKIESNKIIEEIMGRGIDWFDYTKQDFGSWQGYFADAEYINKSDVFNNELHRYITDLVKFIAYEAKDFDQVLHIRTAITALETFRERLRSIEKPQLKKEVENPHDSI